jgi:hypothetical protein
MHSARRTSAGAADDPSTWRATLTRVVTVLGARPAPWLVLAAAAPFLPGAWQFLHRGVPDILFTGDGGTLELRTLHAAHGTQLLGPYSRFKWCHPGPAFFYLALPIYELFHEHGPALNLFAFIANLACAVALTLSAWRLRGTVFALAAATLLAIYGCVDPPFQLSGEWNPMTPILPLALLSLLCARLALGQIETLPPFAFVASAVVQTHIGFLPVVLSLCALAATFGIVRALAQRRAWLTAFRNPGAKAPPRRVAWSLAVAACVLVIAWLPPIVENARGPHGNLHLLYRFFAAPHAPEHTWPIVLETVARQVAFLPLVTARWVGFPASSSVHLELGIALAEVVVVVAAVATGLRRRDDALVVLSSIALAEVAASLAAVRAIRDEIHPYLVTWITIVGWFAATVVVAWVLSVGAHALQGKAASAGLALGAFAVFALCIREQARHTDVFRHPEEDAERLAHDVRQYLVTERVKQPLIRIATGDEWPTAVGVVVDLYKHHVPIFVDRYWLFMMGPQFASRSPGHPYLSIGDRAFYESSRSRPDLRLVATAGDAFALLGDPDYLATHRVLTQLAVVSATGVVGDPARVVDGVIPAEGTQWDSPLSVVLSSTGSAIEVTVPDADVNGVFLSVDGSDTYAVRCTGDDGRPVQLGSVLAGVPIGMGTGFLRSDALRSCRTVTVSPERGDGYYSVAEIGFLKTD